MKQKSWSLGERENVFSESRRFAVSFFFLLSVGCVFLPGFSTAYLIVPLKVLSLERITTLNRLTQPHTSYGHQQRARVYDDDVNLLLYSSDCFRWVSNILFNNLYSIVERFVIVPLKHVKICVDSTTDSDMLRGRRNIFMFFYLYIISGLWIRLKVDCVILSIGSWMWRALYRIVEGFTAFSSEWIVIKYQKTADELSLSPSDITNKS